MVVQAQLHVGFFTIFFIKRASLKRFLLYMKLLQSSTIFKQKVIMKTLAINILHEIFYNSQFKNIISTLRTVTIKTSESTFLLILYFYGLNDFMGLDKDDVFAQGLKSPESVKVL